MEDDESVLGDILEAYGEAVERSLRHRFGGLLNAHDRDELLSDALARLWWYRSSYRERLGDLKTWFYVIARNAALTRLREEREAAARLGGESAWPEDAPLDPRLVLDPGVRADLVRFVTEEVENLSELDQRILAAYAQRTSEGAWTVELAESTALTANALRVRRYRLMRRLRARILERMESQRHDPREGTSDAEESV